MERDKRPEPITLEKVRLRSLTEKPERSVLRGTATDESDTGLYTSFLNKEPVVELFTRRGCEALRVPTKKETTNPKLRGRFHQVGTFQLARAEAAVDAVVEEYAKLGWERHFYTYREYLYACSRIETLRTAQRQYVERWKRWKVQGIVDLPEPKHTLPPVAQMFMHRYTPDCFTTDRTGYLNYLGELEKPLASILSREYPAYITEQERMLHSYVIATTGGGKSELLKVLIHSYVTGDAAAVVVIDPAGEFVEQIARWQEFVGSDKLVYIKHELAQGMTPTINPFQISGIEASDTSPKALSAKRVVAQQLLSGIQEIIAGGMGSTLTTPMRALVRPCILALLDREGSTLRDLQRFMDGNNNSDLVAFGASLTHYDDVQRFFQDAFNGKQYGPTKAAIYTKLQDLFTSGVFADLTCGQSTIDLERVLTERKVLLLSLSKGKIGTDESQSFGRLIVAALQGIAMRRESVPENDRVPCHFFIDECHNFITSSIEEILKEARKYRLHITLCQQNIGDGMSQAMQEIVTGNTEVRFVGKTQPRYRAKAAALIDADPSLLQPLDVGDFQVSRGNKPPLQIKVPSDLLGFHNSMSKTAWRRMQAKQIRNYYRPIVEPPTPPPQSEATSKEPQPETKPTARRRRKII